ncbi:hypothetical protein [Streptomyces pactum]|uniref:Aldehyde dehydrogenase domain-containing protein n=1 Tax=Streptomyces pactum TaxID=68249 RepID=A0A1S6JIG6_9ACTN|nr:hypothetical protein [Streptomyces pactum]AQS71522.1 hypothetical protein B1H29_35870 [Streptomyces pactum]
MALAVTPWNYLSRQSFRFAAPALAATVLQHGGTAPGGSAPFVVLADADAEGAVALANRTEYGLGDAP